MTNTNKLYIGERESDQREQFRAECTAKAKAALGNKLLYSSPYLDDDLTGEIHIHLKREPTVTFAELEELSRAFDTKQIDIVINDGAFGGSDVTPAESGDTYISIAIYRGNGE